MNWEMARYIIAGICTTLVNIGIFSALKYGTGMRMQMANMISMGIEVLGMYGLTELSSVPDLAAKVVLQVIVIGMNYMISKLYIFREDKR